MNSNLHLKQEINKALASHDIKKAIRGCELLLKKEPKSFVALLNLPILYHMAGEVRLDIHERALAAYPDNPLLHYQYGLHLLTLGRFDKGWDEYRWRMFLPNPKTIGQQLGVPFWKGQELRGRHLFIWTEQGIGDELIICSLIPELLNRECKITLFTKDAYPLLKRAFPNVDVIHNTNFLPAHILHTVDFQAGLTELGKYLLPSVDKIKFNKFLIPDDRVQYNVPKDKLVVGISWRSANPQFLKEKAIPLDLWEDVLKVPNVHFMSLQYGDGVREEIAEVEKKYNVVIGEDGLDPKTKNIELYTTQINECDLVITVSNTNAHLAGALDKPVWNLVPNGNTAGLWYWFTDRSDSPWYPSMEIYRRRGNDKQLLKEIAGRLTKVSSAKMNNA